MNRDSLISWLKSSDLSGLAARADAVRARVKGSGVYLRGIIEFSNNCIRNCYYCGLRRSNTNIVRYRMKPSLIVDIARQMAGSGVGTVVLQSGDDPDCSAALISEIIRRIKERAKISITLSLGERPIKDYEQWRDHGADRYLMKHETADPDLYNRLHAGKRLAERLVTLDRLKKLGYEVGTGFIVGLPGQTLESLADDILLVKEMGADMCGAGPFLPQQDTPLALSPTGSIDLTLKVISLLRLTCPEINLPATTALASLDTESGQRRALEHGANVIMPNFTPDNFKKDYQIYDNKAKVDLNTAKEVIRLARRTWIKDGETLNA